MFLKNIRNINIKIKIERIIIKNLIRNIVRNHLLLLIRKVVKSKCMRHYSNKCKLKDKINNLDLEEDLKSKLMKLLINSSSS